VVVGAEGGRQTGRVALAVRACYALRPRGLLVVGDHAQAPPLVHRLEEASYRPGTQRLGLSSPGQMHDGTPRLAPIKPEEKKVAIGPLGDCGG
jgi:hypothetical protein